MSGKCHSGKSTKWQMAALAACALGLVVALWTGAPTASAMPSGSPEVAVTSDVQMRSGGGQYVPPKEMRSGGGQFVSTKPVPDASAAPIHSGDAFDWAAASVGSGFTVVLGGLLTGAVLLLNRRWNHAQLPARSRP